MGPNLGRNKDNNYNRDKWINTGPLEGLGPLRPHTLNALYMEKKEEDVKDLNDDMEEYEIIKGYRVRSEKRKEKETMRYLRVLWNSRQRHERWRDCVLV